MKYHVCREEDVPTGQMRTYTVKNFPVVIVHSKKGEFYAIYGICPLIYFMSQREHLKNEDHLLTLFATGGRKKSEQMVLIF